MTINPGVTLKATGGAQIVINRNINVTVAGTLNVSSPALFAVQEQFGSSTYGIQVTSGGTLTAAGATFSRVGGTNGSDTSRVQVDAGGTLVARRSSFGWDVVTMAANSRANVQYNFFNTLLQLDSRTDVSGNSVRDNYFFNDASPTAVEATLSTTATIDLSNNYWGTTVNSVVDGLIYDQKDLPARPLINYLPKLSAPPVRVVVGAEILPIVYTATNPQNIPVSATVTSTGAAGTVNVNTGTVTFTIQQGSTVFGTPLTRSVSNGMASGTYVVPGGLGAGTYTLVITYTDSSGTYAPSTDSSQTLVINKASQTITFNTPTPVTFPAGAVTLAATSDSGLPITYTIISGPGTLVNGNKVNVTGAGNIVIVASQAGNGNYNAATSVQQTLVVNKGSQTIPPPTVPPGTFPTGPITLPPFTDAGLPITYAVVGGGTGAGTISDNTLTPCTATSPAGRPADRCRDHHRQHADRHPGRHDQHPGDPGRRRQLPRRHAGPADGDD